jgi:hypothetical protein
MDKTSRRWRRIIERRYSSSPLGKRTKRKYYLKRRWGITTKIRNKMFRSQNGVCYICKKPEIRMGKENRFYHLCIDHNHKTGKIRHLLCTPCNRLIGMLENARAPAERYFKYIRGGKRNVKTKMHRM